MSHVFEHGTVIDLVADSDNPEEWVELAINYLDYKNSVDLTVDDNASNVLHNELVSSVESAKELLTKIAEEYPHAFDIHETMEPIRAFFDVTQRIVNMSIDLEDDGHECETCGEWNQRMIRLDFIPASPSHGMPDGYLSVQSGTGCYGGRTVRGNIDEVGSEAIEMLSWLISGVEGNYSEDVQVAIDTIKSNLPD